MKLFNTKSYEHAKEQAARTTQAELNLGVLQVQYDTLQVQLNRLQQSHQGEVEKLKAENAELTEKNKRLIARVREAEKKYQEIVLRLGMKGFAVEVVPARAEQLKLKAVSQ
jgi:hypothetical protein